MVSQTTVSKAGRANDPAGHCLLKASGCGILQGIFQVGSMPHEVDAAQHGAVRAGRDAGAARGVPLSGNSSMIPPTELP